ncbi:MAG: hypothetical protein JXA73_15290 [Acidobacteria bacterium]|nr:hypothetical protein [Acidobacteriota bacterium]
MNDWLAAIRPNDFHSGWAIDKIKHSLSKLLCCFCTPPEAIKKILDCLGIPSKPPPISPAVLESDTEDYIN